jgi:hypothetical protein
MSTNNLAQLTESYIALRTERDRISKEYETEDAKLKLTLSEIEAEMLAVCNSVDADSIRTPHGTVMRTLKERYWANDWENFYKFVLEQQAVELLERRVHQTNMKAFMAEHVDSGLPPGLNVMREYGITVRKASN